MTRIVRPWPWGRVLLGVAGALAAWVMVRAATGGSVPGWLAGLAAFGLIATTALGSFVMASGLFARPILGARAGESSGRLALTFDDGPDPEHTRLVMDLLEARGHRATFFVLGRRAAEHRGLVQEMVRRGHGLGNHSYEHSHGTPALPIRTLAADLERAQALLFELAGQRPRWFRPPMGILSPRVVGAARRVGLELVGWTATARDGTAGARPARSLTRLVSHLEPGAILVLHDAAERGGHRPIVLEILPPLLDALEARGLRSVTLDELLG